MFWMPWRMTHSEFPGKYPWQSTTSEKVGRPWPLSTAPALVGGGSKYGLHAKTGRKFSFLTLNGFHTLFWCFHCWLSTNKCRLGTSILPYLIHMPKYNKTLLLADNYIYNYLHNFKMKNIKKSNIKKTVTFHYVITTLVAYIFIHACVYF